VLVDLYKLKTLSCGLGQFSLHLGQALADQATDDCRLSMLVPWQGRNLLGGRRVSRLIAKPWTKDKLVRPVRQLVQRPHWLKPRFDLWHATNQFAKFLPLDRRIPIVLTIHDLNFLRERDPASCKIALARVQRLVDRSTAITTISNFVADELREHLDLRGKPVHVVYNGLVTSSRMADRRPEYLPEGPFLFSIGEVNPKKNFHVLVPLLRHLEEYRLVIAGRADSDYARSISALAAELGVQDRLVLSGIISDEDRSWLYTHCAAFVFPSLTEGFGLPVIEAMAHGKPVFSSDRTSLPEVGGNAAIYWRDFEESSMIRVFRDGMARFAGNPKMAEENRARARMFSWTRAAQEYLTLYADVINVSQPDSHQSPLELRRRAG